MIFITKFADVLSLLDSNNLKMSNFHLYLFVSICRDVSNINLDNIFDLGTFNVIRDTKMEQRKTSWWLFLTEDKKQHLLTNHWFCNGLISINIFPFIIFLFYILQGRIYSQQSLSNKLKQNHNVRFNSSYYPLKNIYSLLFFLYCLSWHVYIKRCIGYT